MSLNDGLKHYMEIDNNYNKQADAQISFKDLILKLGEWCNYLRDRWMIIIFISVLGAGIGFTYVYFKKPVYTASTTFVLENGESSGGGGGLGQYAGIASMVGIDLGGGGGGIFQGDNIIELYKSRIMIQKTLLTEINHNNKKELLIDRFLDINDSRKSWEGNPKLKNVDFNKKNPGEAADIRLKDSIISTVVTQINSNYLEITKPDKKLNIIKVVVKAKDEFFAKAFNDQIVKNVNDFYVQTKTKKSLDNISILQNKTDSVRSVMNGAIYKSAVISDATPNLNPTRQIERTAPMQKSQFNVETNKVILSELVKNLEMSKLALLKETPLIQVIDQPIFPLEKTKLSKLLGLLAGGFIACFLVIIFLMLKRIIKNVIA